MTINASLSRGLADRALPEIDRCADDYLMKWRRESMYGALPIKRASVRDFVGRLVATPERCLLTHDPEFLAIHERAVERLFLRLRVVDGAAVKEELHDAILLAYPVLAACRALGFRQAVLPTRSGCFPRSIDEGRARSSPRRGSHIRRELESMRRPRQRSARGTSGSAAMRRLERYFLSSRWRFRS